MKDYLVSIWNDVVSIRDLLKTSSISIIATLTGFFLAPSTDTTKQLFFGLFGAILAFILNTRITKPKRTISYSVVGKEQKKE